MNIQETIISALIYTNGPLRLSACQRCGDVSGEGKGH